MRNQIAITDKALGDDPAPLSILLACKKVRNSSKTAAEWEVYFAPYIRQ